MMRTTCISYMELRSESACGASRFVNARILSVNTQENERGKRNKWCMLISTHFSRDGSSRFPLLDTILHVIARTHASAVTRLFTIFGIPTEYQICNIVRSALLITRLLLDPPQHVARVHGRAVYDACAIHHSVRSTSLRTFPC